jgi:hypothetical protein
VSAARLAPALLVASLAFAPTLVAHNGLTCDLVGPRLEAECYAAPDPGCDPDRDGEHTQVVPSTTSSAGAVAFLPNHDCALSYPAVTFAANDTFRSFRAWVTGIGGTHSVTLRVWVDGQQVAQVVTDLDGSPRLVTFTSVTPVPAGSHAVRIGYSATGGTILNLYLDYAELGPVPPGEPTHLRADIGPKPGHVTLQWQAPTGTGSHPITTYRIYRQADDTAEVFYDDMPGDARSYVDRSADLGLRYTYRVSAASAAGEGGKSGPASAHGTFPQDQDGDAVPDRVERELCGRPLVRQLLTLIGVAGTCANPEDYTPPWGALDADGDGIPDAAEPYLCAIENQNDPRDGTCDGNDYNPPA